MLSNATMADYYPLLAKAVAGLPEFDAGSAPRYL